MQRKALIGVLRIMYWLAKEEAIKDLLGCDYLCELCLGKNAQYSSEQIISELLQCLSLVIEEQILNQVVYLHL